MSKLVYFGVIGDRLPPNAKGRTIRRGEKRTKVDFGKLGIWRVPNKSLRDTPLDKEQIDSAREAVEILKGMGLA